MFEHAGRGWKSVLFGVYCTRKKKEKMEPRGKKARGKKGGALSTSKRVPKELWAP